VLRNRCDQVTVVRDCGCRRCRHESPRTASIAGNKISGQNTNIMHDIQYERTPRPDHATLIRYHIHPVWHMAEFI
jgi:hypothetical protein